jgi:hypothetical protein
MVQHPTWQSAVMKTGNTLRWKQQRFSTRRTHPAVPQRVPLSVSLAFGWVLSVSGLLGCAAEPA